MSRHYDPDSTSLRYSRRSYYGRLNSLNKQEVLDVKSRSQMYIHTSDAEHVEGSPQLDTEEDVTGTRDEIEFLEWLYDGEDLLLRSS